MEATIYKCLLVGNMNIPSVIGDQIKSFGFHDLELAKTDHVGKYSPVVNEIETAYSRSTKYPTTNDSDHITEHWAFAPINFAFQLQTVNCSQCGGYVCKEDSLAHLHAHTKMRLRCNCIGKTHWILD